MSKRILVKLCNGILSYYDKERGSYFSMEGYLRDIVE